MVQAGPVTDGPADAPTRGAPAGGRGVLGLVRRMVWWAQDYWYVVRVQVRAALDREGDEAYRVGEPGRSPVVLVPGVYEPWTFLRPLADALHRAGHPVHVLPALGYNRGPVPQAAAELRAVLESADLHDVVVVAHSKGGLIGKLAMLREDPDGRIRAMAAINTPFAGSVYARLVPVRAVRAFVPSDPTLVALAAEREVNSRITSLYSPFDPHIPAGSVLVGATNVALRTPGHFRVLEDPDLPAAVLAAIATTPSRPEEQP